MNQKEITDYANIYRSRLNDDDLDLLEGLSKGSGIDFDLILNFNTLQEILYTEGCTSFAAVGNATFDGNGYFLKNRDRPSWEKEISVVQICEYDGNLIVGVTVAGYSGIMMGMNSNGVVAASNYGQTIEVNRLSSKKLFGISSRTQILRKGLEYTSAKEATNYALRELTNMDMETPGILFFVDSRNIYVVEGSFGQFAVQHITNGAIVRSNHFSVLNHLNDQQHISSICRKTRGMELIEKNYGFINSDRFVDYSMDHKNGPGDNSICRHGSNPDGLITDSSVIMELNASKPELSKIKVAFGNPCKAWENSYNHFSFQMDNDISMIPEGFINGTAYKDIIKDRLN